MDARLGLPKPLILAVSVLAIPACSGSSTPTPRQTPTYVYPRVPAEPSGVSFSVDFPAGAVKSIAATLIAKDGAFISPTTKSIAVLANPTCSIPTDAGDGLRETCHLFVPAPPGDDHFDLAVYPTNDATGASIASTGADALVGTSTVEIGAVFASSLPALGQTLSLGSPIIARGAAIAGPISVNELDATGQIILGQWPVKLVVAAPSAAFRLSANGVVNETELILGRSTEATFTYDGSDASSPATFTANAVDGSLRSASVVVALHGSGGRGGFPPGSAPPVVSNLPTVNFSSPNESHTFTVTEAGYTGAFIVQSADTSRVVASIVGNVVTVTTTSAPVTAGRVAITVTGGAAVTVPAVLTPITLTIQ